ncbi:MAG: alkaline shock response membrane anchor protein AmaP [Clostridiales bacterium]
MSVFNKFFSFIFGCILVISGILIFTDGLGFTYVAEFLSDMLRNGVKDPLTLLVGGLVFILGMVIILAILCIKPPKSVKVPGTQKANAVYVTLNTIENMAKTTAMAVPGVVTVNTKIKNSHQGLCLRVRISVSYDDKITAVTEQLQDDIKTLIEASTSLPVKSVEVLVIKAAGEKDAATYRTEAKTKEFIVPTEDNKGDKQL